MTTLLTTTLLATALLMVGSTVLHLGNSAGTATAAAPPDAVLAAAVATEAVATVRVATVRVAPASTVRLTTGRNYVVSTRLGGKVVRGKGKVPTGVATGNVSARPARHVLGPRSAEVLIDFGSAAEDASVHLYSLHTIRRGKLRAVTLDGSQVVLATYTEGGDDGGFRCKGGRLFTHWYHHGSQQGEQTDYRLAGSRLMQGSTTPLRSPVENGPTSCA